MPGRISFSLIRTSISNQVDKHKTDRAYGNTCLALNHREVSWLRSLVDVSVQFGGDRCDYVFQNNGNQLTKICEELRAAWRDARMPGRISFGLIRTSISNQVDKHKTDRAYGNTCLALNHREVSWLRSLVDVSVQFGGDRCDYVFQYNGNQLTKICEERGAAWRDAQMPGRISFSLIRTSISNQVDKHKTDRAYGNTCLALNHREVSWLRSLVDVSGQFGGDRCDYVFQYNGNQLTKICEELRAAWRDAQMPGRISFSLIRTSISNQVDKHKTDRAYGNTCLALNHREVSWLRSLLDVSVQFGGDRCDYVFQYNGNQMTKICKELRAAWRDAQMPSRISFSLIRTSISNQVDKHKTDRAYGNTCLALNHREVSWLRSLVDVSVQFGGDRCDYVFQNNGNQLTKICEELRAAWRDARMPGRISFGLIRTSISNQVDKHKTDRAYGNTCLALNHREVSWLRSLVDVSVQFGGDRCDYVFQNNGNQLTKICEELRAAWRDTRMPGRISFSLIRTSISNQVDKHKTDRAYGNTCLALNHREVSWLRSLVDVSVQFGGDRCDYVFQYNGNQLTKICEELRAAWRDAQMPGRISFSLIRTSISNQVDKHKTDRAYGNTCLALNHREVSWLRSLVDVSVQFGGDRCDYVFQYNGNQMTKICKELRAAWRDAQMPSRISFSLIRTSISNQVDKHKTDRAYGNTCLALNHREVSWLRSLVDVSVQFGGDRCDYVFQNNGNQLTKICEELRAAWRDTRMPGRISFSLIRTSISNQVDKHKTDRAYGNTCLALNHREVSWLRSLVDVSVQFGGDRCDYVFQYNGNQLTKICEELRAAWRDAQMPGRISFSLIRTSISNQVDKHKTDRAYGNTCLALNHREVSWLRSLVDVSVQFGGDRCDYVFQYNGNQMTKICKELRAAWRDAQMPSRISFSLIRTSISNQVDKHKTDRAYGNTCLALNHREVSWLRSVVDVSVQFGGDRCDYVFQNNGNQLTKICEELRAAWRDTRMPGRISFSLIRTSISNQARPIVTFCVPPGMALWARWQEVLAAQAHHQDAESHAHELQLPSASWLSNHVPDRERAIAMRRGPRTITLGTDPREGSLGPSRVGWTKPRFDLGRQTQDRPRIWEHLLRSEPSRSQLAMKFGRRLSPVRRRSLRLRVPIQREPADENMRGAQSRVARCPNARPH
ncbi:hypothetical protein SRHO_G00269960 [Serrasalmus rhombeus]